MDALKIDWDSPAKAAAISLSAARRPARKQPKTGCIITARYHGTNVRMRVVDRDGDKSSIAQVIGVDTQEDRDDARILLNEGDTVLVPDSKRAVVRY
ncbi:hypothetical protein R84981_002143 [Carnimonas sp. R-84981]|uniref:hypothetical protein n=1 Tax=Carnimonas bestiolae TaxID=3402172 RepID=UPI003EDC91FB